jgi:hypothetical protein
LLTSGDPSVFHSAGSGRDLEYLKAPANTYEDASVQAGNEFWARCLVGG